MPGFREHDVELIAQIARYHRKSKPKNSHEPFAGLDDTDRHTVRALAAVLRIAIGLDRSYDARVHEVAVKRKGSKISIEALSSDGSDLSLNLYSARERADLLADVTGCTVEIK
jgi:exopolyphosphatase/guanosine-5'-triphosphate,3'-diphosphate pyrophosphatase